MKDNEIIKFKDNPSKLVIPKNESDEDLNSKNSVEFILEIVDKNK